MAMTTIRVEAEVRDRLAARATTHGRSLGAELQAMLDGMMWQGIGGGDRRVAAPRGEERVGRASGRGHGGRAAQGGERAPYRAGALEGTRAGRGDLAATAADEY